MAITDQNGNGHKFWEMCFFGELSCYSKYLKILERHPSSFSHSLAVNVMTTWLLIVDNDTERRP